MRSYYSLLGSGVTAAVVAAVTSGCGSSSSLTMPNAATNKPAPALVTQQQFLAGLLRQLPDNSPLIAATLRPSPPEFDQPGSVCLYYTVRARNGYEFARGAWHGLLLTGVLRDESTRQGWDTLAGEDVTIVKPDGRNEHESTTRIFPPITPAPKQVSRTRLIGLLRKSLESARLELKRLRIWKVGEGAATAVEATVIINDSRRVRREASSLVQQIFDPINRPPNRIPLAEGTYLEVEDRDGDKLMAAGVTNRRFAGIGPVMRR